MISHSMDLASAKFVYSSWWHVLIDFYVWVAAAGYIMQQLAATRDEPVGQCLYLWKEANAPKRWGISTGLHGTGAHLCDVSGAIKIMQMFCYPVLDKTSEYSTISTPLLQYGHTGDVIWPIIATCRCLQTAVTLAEWIVVSYIDVCCLSSRAGWAGAPACSSVGVAISSRTQSVAEVCSISYQRHATTGQHSAI